jgi:hypothetical protein
MAVTLQLANQVRWLGRKNLTVQQIAKRLALPEAAILETLSMLGLPLPGVTLEERIGPTDEERAALRMRMPKRWQDRMDKTRL